MTAFTQQDERMFGESAGQVPPGKWSMVVLMVWAAMGPIAFFFYGNHVYTREWAELSAMPALQADLIRAAYFSGGLLNSIYGGIGWAIILAALLWNARGHFLTSDR